MGNFSPAERARIRALGASEAAQEPAASMTAALRATLASAAQGATADAAAAWIAAHPWAQIGVFEARAAQGDNGGSLAVAAPVPEPDPDPEPTGPHYYVSSVHANRSDGNPGTDPTAPWATLEKVKSMWAGFPAGTTVHLGRGSTFNFEWGASAPWWIVTSGGDLGNPKVLRGDDYGSGDLPVLLRSGGAGWGTAIAIAASNVTLRSFVLDGSSLGTTGVTVGGYYLTGPIGHVQVRDLRLQNLGLDGSHYCCGVEVAGQHGYAVSDCLVQGCEASEYTGHGFNHYPEKTPMVTTSRNVRVTWRNNIARGARPSVWAGTGSGFHYACGGEDNVVEGTVIEGSNPAGGIMVMNCSGDDENIIIRQNHVRENPASNALIILNDHNGAQNTFISARIYSNIFASSKYAGVSLEGDNGIRGNIHVFNNTFLDCRTDPGGVPANGGVVFFPNINAGLDLRVTNNVFIQTTSAAPCICALKELASHSNNLFWRASGGTAVYDRGASYSYSGVAGWEATALSQDPLFVGAVPSAVSPAVDSGAEADAECPEDFSGGVRTGSWDRGAYEYGAAPAPSPTPSPGASEPIQRMLDTAVYNGISGAGLDNSGRLVLPQGTYWVRAWAAAYDVGAHRLVLDCLGTLHYGRSATATGIQSESAIEAVLVLPGLTPVALKHYAPGAPGADTDGGKACDIDDQDEVFAGIFVRRIS